MIVINRLAHGVGSAVDIGGSVCAGRNWRRCRRSRDGVWPVDQQVGVVVIVRVSTDHELQQSAVLLLQCVARVLDAQRQRPQLLVLVSKDYHLLRHELKVSVEILLVVLGTVLETNPFPATNVFTQHQSQGTLLFRVVSKSGLLDSRHPTTAGAVYHTQVTRRLVHDGDHACYVPVTAEQTVYVALIAVHLTVLFHVPPGDTASTQIGARDRQKTAIGGFVGDKLAPVKVRL